MKLRRGKEVAGLVAGLTVEHATCFEEILSRLKVASGVNSDADLALKIGLTRSSISTAKTRGMIPPSWIVNVSNLFNVSADWLIYGDKKYPEKIPEKSQPAPASTARAETKINHDYSKINEEWALDLTLAQFEELWDEYRGEKEGRRGWLQVEVIKRFPEFLKWLEQRQVPLRPAQIDSLKIAAQSRQYELPAQAEED
jgi:hypothetical protein